MKLFANVHNIRALYKCGIITTRITIKMVSVHFLRFTHIHIFFMISKEEIFSCSLHMK